MFQSLENYQSNLFLKSNFDFHSLINLNSIENFKDTNH